MKIAGWHKVSLIDYPGKIATVIFLAGCNMRCHYCHNSHILDAKQNTIPLVDVVCFLRQRKKFIDAVVISGGEPTLYPDLIPLLRLLKADGFLIKLDTNGTRPKVLQQAVNLGLVDYVALDVKAPAKKYPLVTGVSITNVLVAVQYLKQQNHVEYMLRTTVSPYLSIKDLQEIGEKIVNGASLWQIQQCRCAGACSYVELQKTATLLKNYALHIVVK